MKRNVWKHAAVVSAAYVLALSLLVPSCKQSDDDTASAASNAAVTTADENSTVSSSDAEVVDNAQTEDEAQAEESETSETKEEATTVADETQSEENETAEEASEENSEAATDAIGAEATGAGDASDEAAEDTTADTSEETSDATASDTASSEASAVEEGEATTDTEAEAEEAASTTVVPAAVGDVLLRDGTRISQSQLSAASVSSSDVAAVVAYVTDDGFVACGLPLSEAYAWATSGCAGATKIIADIACSSSQTGSGAANESCTFDGDCDGSDNWEIIAAFDEAGAAEASTYYPAFAAVSSYATSCGLSDAIADGWYLPAISELYSFYQNLTVINESLSTLGVETISGSLWSSTCPVAAENTDYTKSAWYLNIASATIYMRTKAESRSVLPFRVFE